jgi:hypothetical protein
MSEERGFWARLKTLTAFLGACVAIAALFSQCADNAFKRTSEPQTIIVPQTVIAPAAPVNAGSFNAPARPGAVQEPTFAAECVTADGRCPLAEQLRPGALCYCHILGIPVSMGVAR